MSRLTIILIILILIAIAHKFLKKYEFTKELIGIVIIVVVGVMVLLKAPIAAAEKVVPELGAAIQNKTITNIDYHDGLLHDKLLITYVNSDGTTTEYNAKLGLFMDIKVKEIKDDTSYHIKCSTDSSVIEVTVPVTEIEESQTFESK